MILKSNLFLRTKAKAISVNTVAKVSGIACFMFSTSFGNGALAQIIPDASLESEASVVQPSIDGNNISIEGGGKTRKQFIP